MRQLGNIELFLEECAYHACLNHHLDTFIFDGIDLRAKLKSDLTNISVLFQDKITINKLE